MWTYFLARSQANGLPNWELAISSLGAACSILWRCVGDFCCAALLITIFFIQPLLNFIRIYLIQMFLDIVHWSSDLWLQLFHATFNWNPICELCDAYRHNASVNITSGVTQFVRLQAGTNISSRACWWRAIQTGWTGCKARWKTKERDSVWEEFSVTMIKWSKTRTRTHHWSQWNQLHLLTCPATVHD